MAWCPRVPDLLTMHAVHSSHSLSHNVTPNNDIYDSFYIYLIMNTLVIACSSKRRNHHLISKLNSSFSLFQTTVKISGKNMNQLSFVFHLIEVYDSDTMSNEIIISRKVSLLSMKILSKKVWQVKMVYELRFCLIFCGMRANDYFLSPIIFMCILLNLSLDHVKRFRTCENTNIVRTWNILESEIISQIFMPELSGLFSMF